MSIAELALHTPAPILLLTDMVRETALVEVGRTPRGEADCFFGWAARQHQDGSCLPHHVVSSVDDETVLWVAKTLMMLGHQVVVTAPDRHGDHAVVDSMPEFYLADHTH